MKEEKEIKKPKSGSSISAIPFFVLIFAYIYFYFKFNGIESGGPYSGAEASYLGFYFSLLVASISVFILIPIDTFLSKVRSNYKGGYASKRTIALGLSGILIFLSKFFFTPNSMLASLSITVGFCCFVYYLIKPKAPKVP